MTRRSTYLLPAALLACALPLQAQEAPEADTPEEIEAVVVAGPQWVDEDGLGRGEARFREFRDIPQGFAFEFGRFSWQPRDQSYLVSFTAMDVAQDDQRYFLDVSGSPFFSFAASYVELPRFYSSGSKTLWSGAGSGFLTLSETFRQGAETAAGDPTSPFASATIQPYMQAALDGTGTFDLKTKRREAAGRMEFLLARGLALRLAGNFSRREGTRPLGFGTYVRRQALSGVPNTGPGFFWRETIEARGSELIEPLDHAVTEFGATLSWARKGHTVSAGWFGSIFRNDISALYFDNPFEATPGRASATVFDPAADQEPAAPNGSNQLRGLYARSATQLWPDNDYDRIFVEGSFRLGGRTRLSAIVARGKLEQDDPFLPYAENDQVVSSLLGDPVELARNKALPQPSLRGEMTTTQADLKVTSTIGRVALRAGYRWYELEDDRPSIFFPGYSSAGDSYFRRGIGQTVDGQKALFNEIGGYTRDRLDFGVAVKAGPVTLDGAYVRTAWDYEERQVDETVDDAFQGTVRFLLGGANVNVGYLHGSRDYEGSYAVGLELSGVRAYDVWTRDRDQVTAEVDAPLSETLVLTAGGSYLKDEYPGAVQGFTYGYGLQDSESAAVHAGVTWAKDAWLVGGFAGYDAYEWNSLQVTKTSLTTDYNPTNRWTRRSSDDVVWIGVEVAAPIGSEVTIRGDVNYQRFTGDWATQNLATPDINSAVAYSFPELSDSTLTARASVLWAINRKVSLEGRYWYEPYRLDDFTWDSLQPYMLGVLQETRSAPGDIGDMNAGRFLFLDSRYTDYTAHVLSVFVHAVF